MKLLFITTLLFYCMHQTNAQNVGIGTNAPNDKLDVVGNGHFSGYLKVGNPSPPQSVNQAGIQLYGMDAGSYYNGFTTNNICGTTIWQGTIVGNTLQDRGGLQWDNQGNTARSELYSPWIFVHSAANSIVVEMGHYCTLEDGFDGVYIQYSTDGTNWNDVPNANFFLGGYTNVMNTVNPACGGFEVKDAWSGNQENMVTAFGLTLSDTWVRFRLVASEDGSVGDGEYWLFNFNTFVNVDGALTTGGAFAPGNIYAENNIYAGSNVLIGDLAEYFKVTGPCQPGDLISMTESSQELYSRSSQAYDQQIIGIYSSRPTLTLNDPNSGVPIGLQGRVPVNIVGKIQKGDYLTASEVPGKAMKADKSCFVVGRALESSSGDKAQVLCLIQNGWYNPGNNSHINSGQAVVGKGQTKMNIYDKSMQATSKVFVSLLGNPGPGNIHWIAQKEPGFFSIAFNNPLQASIKIDYMIESTTATATPANTTAVSTQISIPTLNFGQSSNKTSSNRALIPSIAKVGATLKTVPAFESGSPPTVDDRTKGYYWAPHIQLQASNAASDSQNK